MKGVDQYLVADNGGTFHLWKTLSTFILWEQRHWVKEATACTITLDLVYSTTGNQCSAVDARVALIRFLVLCQAV